MRLIYSMPYLLNQFAVKCSLLNLIALYHIRLDSFNDFFLTLFVDLLFLANLAKTNFQFILSNP